MANIASLITSNVALALTLIKQWLGQPNVGGIPIKSTRFDCIMEAEVSRHVLINLMGGLQNVMDNVAPGPRTWEIEGTVGGIPLELSSLYMPSIKAAVDYLDGLFQSRQQTTLLDPDFRTFDVFISNFTYSYDPAIQNRIKVKLSLVQVFILTASVAPTGTVPTLQQNATPAAGGLFSSPVNLGSVPSVVPTVFPPAVIDIPGFVPVGQTGAPFA
jgi:hypothetical protein